MAEVTTTKITKKGGTKKTTKRVITTETFESDGGLVEGPMMEIVEATNGENKENLGYGTFGRIQAPS